MLHDSTAYVIIFNGHVIAWIELGRRIHKDDGNMAVCQTLIHIRVDVAVERIQNQSVHPELDDVFDDFPLALLGAVGEFDGHTDVFVAEIGFRPFYNGEGLGGAEEHEEYHVILLAGADDIVDEGSFFRSAGQQVLGYQNLQGFPHRHPGSSVNLHQFHFGGDLRARLVNPALDLCQDIVRDALVEFHGCQLSFVLLRTMDSYKSNLSSDDVILIQITRNVNTKIQFTQ